MVKEIDETLWKKRMEEKERLHREREAAKATAEAERLRLERGKSINIQDDVLAQKFRST